MLRHPAHWIALGFGSGLSRWAPGTLGTLWAWLSFVLLDRWLGEPAGALLIVAALARRPWACTLTARDLAVADPGAIVWDEMVAFWVVLWLVTPTSASAQWWPSRCSAISTPPSPGRWPGPTSASSCGRASPSAGARALGSCSTTWWPPCARCW